LLDVLSVKQQMILEQ